MSAAPPFLPYGRQDIDEADIDAVVRTLRGDWLTQGPAVTAFETALARRVGAEHAVSCANGTAALHLAYSALDLRPGDAVVVPAITFLATAAAAALTGAAVVFADVDPATGLMTPETAEAAITRAQKAGLRPRVVAPVHLAGQTADTAGVADVAAAAGGVAVEDACHALGTASLHDDGRLEPTGACSRSLMTVFSFHPVKTVAAGEGGAITLNDPDLARRLARLRNHGMTREPAEFVLEDLAFDADGAPNPWHYEQVELGFNYRLSDIHAALASSQLRRLDAFVARRAALRDLYAERLAGLSPHVRLTPTLPRRRPAWHLATVAVDFAAVGRSRAAVMAGLRSQGVGTQVHYIPVHLQPYWRKTSPTPPLPGAEAFFRSTLSLPLFPAMSDDDPARVVAALEKALALEPT